MIENITTEKNNCSFKRLKIYIQTNNDKFVLLINIKIPLFINLQKKRVYFVFVYYVDGRNKMIT